MPNLFIKKVCGAEPYSQQVSNFRQNFQNKDFKQFLKEEFQFELKSNSYTSSYGSIQDNNSPVSQG